MPDPQFDQPRFCSRCGQPIVVTDAQFCKDCGAPVAGTEILVRDPGFSPIVAFVLSAVPGLGHVYKGRVMRGVVWFCVVMICYAMGTIGPVMHFICALNAAFQGAPRGDDFTVARFRRRRMRGPRATAPPSDTWRY